MAPHQGTGGFAGTRQVEWVVGGDVGIEHGLADAGRAGRLDHDEGWCAAIFSLRFTEVGGPRPCVAASDGKVRAEKGGGVFHRRANCFRLGVFGKRRWFGRFRLCLCRLGGELRLLAICDGGDRGRSEQGDDGAEADFHIEAGPFAEVLSRLVGVASRIVWWMGGTGGLGK